MRVRCGYCGEESEQAAAPDDLAPREPPDLDTRPGAPLRQTLSAWVQCCPRCGYCAADIATVHERAIGRLQSAEYQELLGDAALPRKSREFLCFALVLSAVPQDAEAGWSALHAAWACDDAGNGEAAARCRAAAIAYWQRAKQQGQSFADTLPEEYALVVDVYRRMGDFENALITCSDALDFEDLPSVLDAILRRQRVFIAAKDASRHHLGELIR